MIRKLLRAYQILRSYPYKGELLAGIKQDWYPIFIKYPVHPRPRFGYNGIEPHRTLYEIINRRRDAYQSLLLSLKKYEDDLLRIKTVQPDDSYEPYWNNLWFSGLDAVALYGLVASTRPRLYLEIGSGNSTKFVKQAISDHRLPTKIISVDPHPRAVIDSISDEIIRKPLEQVDLRRFDELRSDDILFFDGSHRCFMNSDVTVFFLEILPRLPSGMLTHIHDIHLPYDYPPERARHYESEQYLLAAMLLGGCTDYEIVLPNRFIIGDETLFSSLAGLWDSKEPRIPRQGLSFWIRKHESRATPKDHDRTKDGLSP